MPLKAPMDRLTMPDWLRKFIIAALRPEVEPVVVPVEGGLRGRLHKLTTPLLPDNRISVDRNPATAIRRESLSTIYFTWPPAAEGEHVLTLESRGLWWLPFHWTTSFAVTYVSDLPRTAVSCAQSLQVHLLDVLDQARRLPSESDTPAARTARARLQVEAQVARIHCDNAIAARAAALGTTLDDPVLSGAWAQWVSAVQQTGDELNIHLMPA